MSRKKYQTQSSRKNKEEVEETSTLRKIKIFLQLRDYNEVALSSIAWSSME